MKNLLFIFFTLLTSLVFSQSLNLEEVCTLPSSLKENSGMITINTDSFYIHNDGGNSNELFLVNKDGNILETYTILNATNIDWEDLAKDNQGNIYIGDFGNNSNSRTALKIYKIHDPLTASTTNLSAQTISFEYPDQSSFPPPSNSLNFDMEAMICFNDSIYLFSKNRTSPFNGFCKLYTLPNTPGSYVATLRDSLFTGTGLPEFNWITAASINPSMNKIALLSHSKIWVLEGFNNDDFFGGTNTLLQLPFFSQKEAISFFNDEDFYLSDEVHQLFGGGKVYHGNFNAFTNLTESGQKKLSIDLVVKSGDSIKIDFSYQSPAKIECTLFAIDGKKLSSKRQVIKSDTSSIEFVKIKNSAIIIQLVDRSHKRSLVKKIVFKD